MVYTDWSAVFAIVFMGSLLIMAIKKAFHKRVAARGNAACKTFN